MSFVTDYSFSCVKCLDNPCHCGYEYKHYTWLQLSEFIAGILSYKEKEEALKILKHSIDIVKDGHTKIN